MIKKITDLLLKYKELILYGITGVATTLVNLSVFWLFGKILGEDLYLVSNAIAWFFAIVFSYIVNKLVVFQSKSFDARTLVKEIGIFFSSRIFTFGIEEGGMWLLVDALGFGEKSLDVVGIEIGGQMISKLIVGVVVVIINYLVCRFITFAKKEK